MDEALPNITGSSGGLFGGPTEGYPTKGVFREQRNLDRNYSNGSGTTNGWVYLTFDASLSSSIYQTDAHVTPLSCGTIFILKY